MTGAKAGLEISQKCFALLDNNYRGVDIRTKRFDGSPESYLFTELVDWVICDDLKGAQAALEAIERSEHFAVGYISYEFAQAFGYASKPAPPQGLPYLQFGLFAKREVLTPEGAERFLEERFAEGEAFASDLEVSTSLEKYKADIASIKAELEAGNSYQVNYTLETKLRLGGCPFRLYQALREAQPVPYGAFLNFGNVMILSRSPELFFAKYGDDILCKPMKGTEPRSDAVLQDHLYRSHLIASPKQRAENLMIVDLLRNDLSRVAEVGSVDVDRLFEVETYKTVHQMTSTISAKIKDKRLSEIFEALFPCGSITGAPKLITTEIIDRLEPHARGVYCGAIGVVEPEGDMVFNVPIRTLTVSKGDARFCLGGGVVYDSADSKEYDEAILKGKFLFEMPVNFHLIDSHYYSPQTGARHVERHLARLERSALALRFAFDLGRVEAELEGLYAGLDFEAKIRVEAFQNGEVKVEALALDLFEGEKFVGISPVRTDRFDAALAHKTSNRGLYNRAFQEARARGDYEVLFANADGHLTEGAIHNVVLRFGDGFVTPPLEDGVLPGIGREVFLEEHPETRVESVGLDALLEADEVFLVSSVRGVVPVRVRG